MRKLFNFFGWLVVLYFAYFALWFVLAAGCIQHNPNQCGGDSMTASVRVLYGWLLK